MVLGALVLFMASGTGFFNATRGVLFDYANKDFEWTSRGWDYHGE